jgi:hypothetical protein
VEDIPPQVVGDWDKVVVRPGIPGDSIWVGRMMESWEDQRSPVELQDHAVRLVLKTYEAETLEGVPRRALAASSASTQRCSSSGCAGRGGPGRSRCSKFPLSITEVPQLIVGVG